jgi:hypothetical protein
MTAPYDRALSVGNIVRRVEDEPFFFGSIKVPDYLKKIFNFQDEKSTLNFEELMSLDDECYMGKDGNAEECVDFDPPVLPS